MSIKGSQWQVKINGRKHVNGALYCVTYSGDILLADEHHNIYDFMRQLADHLEEKNVEMTFPTSFQIILVPKTPPSVP